MTNANLGFWYFARYNPPALFGYWWRHMQQPSEAFWIMLAWNSPSFESWLEGEK